MYGFDLFVFNLLQRDDQWENWIPGSDANVPKASLVTSTFKYIIPPQYDQWIKFEPYVATSGFLSDAGYIRM